MRIRDWSSDVCSSDLSEGARRSDDESLLRFVDVCHSRGRRPDRDGRRRCLHRGWRRKHDDGAAGRLQLLAQSALRLRWAAGDGSVLRRLYLRSEEHTSELQSLMRISYAVFCLKKKKK